MNPKTNPKKQRAATVCSASLLVLLAYTFFFYRNFHTIQVSGPSMEPTFISGDRLLASSAYWLVGEIKPNDIVVIESEEPGEDTIIKRVYKIEGETVDWLNVPNDYSLAQGEYVVPKGSIYILGDNREVSEDSRRFGAVPRDRILGKIVLKKWL